MISVVVATPDIVGRRMAGPGIRALALAREIGKSFPVTLVARLVEAGEVTEGLATMEWESGEARRAMRAATALVAQPRREVLAARHPRAFYDLFDPLLLELDELVRGRLAPRLRLHRTMERRRLAEALATGYRLIAATPQQQEYYERLHPVADPGARWLRIPFGVDEAEVERGEAPFPPGPPVLVWGGGSWAWLDPELAVEAVARLNAEGDPCRLLFLGGARPGSGPSKAIPERPWVIANREWVPWRERGRWLSPCRAAIVLHRRTPEAEASIRTRMFDAIWCGVPIVASRGGWSAELVEREGLGLVVEPESVGALVVALRRMLRDDALHARSVENLERVRPELRWDVVTRPLIAELERLRA